MFHRRSIVAFAIFGHTQNIERGTLRLVDVVKIFRKQVNGPCIIAQIVLALTHNAQQFRLHFRRQFRALQFLADGYYIRIVAFAVTNLANIVLCALSHLAARRNLAETFFRFLVVTFGIKDIGRVEINLVAVLAVAAETFKAHFRPFVVTVF